MEKLSINARCFALFCVLLGLGGSQYIVAQTQSSLQQTELPDAPHKKSDRTDILYGISIGYLAAATTVDCTSTAKGMGLPTLALRADHSPLAYDTVTESGWTSHFFGERNTSAAVGANVALNLGVAWASRSLYRRGWRKSAIALNVLKGTGNVVAGIRNMQSNSDAARDARIRLATGYNGAIVWSR